MLHWRLLGIVMFLLVSAGSLQAAEPTKKKPNILFIAVDDLNHWVGHLGRNKQVKTPNLDRLAKMGRRLRVRTAQPPCAIHRARH